MKFCAADKKNLASLRLMGVIKSDNIFAPLTVINFNFTISLGHRLSRVICKSTNGMLFRNSYFVLQFTKVSVYLSTN